MSAATELPDTSAVREAVAALLHDRCTAEVVDDAERTGWAPSVWEPLAGGGFPSVGVPEDAGGVGGSVADACAVLAEVGAAAAPVPVAETGLLAGRLLAAAGLEVPDGPLSTVDTRAPVGGPSRSGPTGVPGSSVASWSVSWRDGVLTGRARRVPWARSVHRLVLLAGSAEGPVVVVVDPATATVTPGRNLAGEPRDTVDLDGVRPEAGAPAPAPAPAGAAGAAQALALRGALSRAALIAGASRRVLDLTIAHTGERHQFGRPVSAFPAVAAHLVRIAEQAEAAGIAVRSAAANAGPTGEPALLDVAAAASVTSEAAGAVAAAAHQATGAMGATREFELGRLTRRLWSWRDEWGGGRAWSTRLGRELAAGGPDALWPTLARGCSPRV